MDMWRLRVSVCQHQQADLGDEFDVLVRKWIDSNTREAGGAIIDEGGEGKPAPLANDGPAAADVFAVGARVTAARGKFKGWSGTVHKATEHKVKVVFDATLDGTPSNYIPKSSFRSFDHGASEQSQELDPARLMKLLDELRQVR